ncbi:MAG: hypothetical protein SPLM_01360 [Spiroplasma phoeniceum]|uniref:hypothetical protein n=1 Tax=Spiroplasma phoeniceum TaxID=47835 RepID=UPI003287F83E
MNKLLSLLSTIIISVTIIPMVIVENFYQSQNIRNKRQIESHSLSRVSLSTVITNPNLGELPNNNCETILARLSERNPNVDITQIIVTFVSDNEDGIKSWRISPSSNSIYYGSNNIRSANNYEIWNN